jgi:hypothetical protein
MAYIGNQPTSTAFVTDLFSGNGSTTAFTMSVAPANTASILIAVSGVVQSPDTYSINATTLTFSAAPPTGTGNISVRYLGIPATNVTTTAYRTVTEFTATASQTTFSVPSYTVGYVDVYRNGVRLGTADYTATSGTTVVLANAATIGDLVTTESFYVSSVLNAIPSVGGAVNNIYLDSGNANGTGALLTPSGTTAQRPASPAAGMQRWNTTLGIMEAWTGTVWTQVTSLLYSANYLVVAGGGGGGFSYGGGGGGGGLISNTTAFNAGTAYTITVGAGGAGSTSSSAVGSSGANSLLGSIATAIGGGGGGSSSSTNGISGGSGGGASYTSPRTGGSGTAGQGYAGGNGATDGVNYSSTGAGGGAGAVGGTGTANTGTGAVGGIGASSSISGTAVYYSGGGGAVTDASPRTGGAGGTGGGGAGNFASTAGSGTINTGGGGGGTSSGTAGAGGSGIVIISYLGSQRGSGGTVTSSGGYTIHTFTSSGTYNA